MPEQLRAGLIGAGFMGAVHARAIRAAGAALVQVATSTPAGGHRAAQRLNTTPADSATALIASDDVDVVHICTPNADHAAFAHAAITAGKSVVCEKPLAVSVDQARGLVDAAQHAGVVASVPFVYRFYPMVREARARITDGGTGRLTLLHGSYLQDWLSDPATVDWRVDPSKGGPSRAFGDIGVHWCDLAEFVTGHRIVRLVARASTAHERIDATATEDAFSVIFETDRGAMGSLMVSQISPGRKNRLWFSFDGTEQSVSFDQESPEQLWLGGREQNIVLLRGAVSAPADRARLDILPPGHPQGYQECFNAFVADTYAAIRGQDPDGLPTFLDGLRAAELTTAVLRSHRADQWVTV